MSSSPENRPASLWLSHPVQAHQQWRAGLLVAERAYADHSQKLYASLFGRFCAWMATQGREGQPLTLGDIGAHQIGLFLDSLVGRNNKPASARTRRTYLAEIDRVMRHLQGQGLRPDNPALGLLDTARIIAPLRPRSIHLPALDVPARFHAWLRDLDASGSDAVPAPQLQAICMALLMMEHGLTLKELQKLLLMHARDVAERSRITTPGHRTLSPRALDLDPVTQRWLLRWLSVRQSLHVISRHGYAAIRQDLQTQGYRWSPQAWQELDGHKPRQSLFVTFAGKAPRQGEPPSGLRAMGLAIDRLGDAVIYDAAEAAVFALSDASAQERKQVRHKGPQALRNLCCARRLARGEPAGEVAQLLGLRRNDQVWAMGRQLRLERTGAPQPPTARPNQAKDEVNT